MTQEPKDTHTELRRLARMLEKTASMAEHASLTGSLAGGKEFAARSYNSVVEHLARIGEIPPGLFSPLSEDTSLDAVGIASAQLAEYLRAGLPDEEQQKAKGGSMIGGDGFVINLGGLGDIGELVREHLPEWLRGKRGQPEPTENASAQSESAEAPAPPNAAASAGPSGEPARVARLSLPSQRARIEELRAEQHEPQTPQ
jgi:hypothetical protein